MRTTVFSRFSLLPASLPAWRSRVAPLSFALLSAFALGGCSSINEPVSVKGFLAFIAPYKPDVIQGNVVTTEQIALVKPGMTRAQVREALGSPLITDPFHNDRWDYVFTLKRQGFDDQARSFVVVFEKDAVQKIDAPALPSEDEFVASISRKKLPTSTPKLELTDAERAALPVPVAAAAPAASAVVLAGATRSYPPLETATP
jgi:outer membrane protein assembly factor BamE